MLRTDHFEARIQLDDMPLVPALPAVLQVSAGEAHTCAVTRVGSLLCWGQNAAGQLGLGSNMALTPQAVRNDF